MTRKSRKTRIRRADIGVERGKGREMAGEMDETKTLKLATKATQGDKIGGGVTRKEGREK